MSTTNRRVALLAPLALAGLAHASEIYSQANGPAASLYSSQSGLGILSQVADDFTLERASRIGGVRFWGGFYNGAPTSIASFNVMIYSDAGGMPTGTPGDPTSTALRTYTVTATSALDPAFSGNGFDVYRYDATFDFDFIAARGTTYWIAIQANLDFPPQWGWAVNGTNASGYSAHQWMPDEGLPTWTVDTAGGTLADPQTIFKLYGTVIPTPAAAGLAACGLLGLGARRRGR